MGEQHRKMITGDQLAEMRVPLIGHIHMGYKRVKCQKCSEVKNLKDVEGAGKCPKCGTAYRKDARGIAFYTQATNHFVIDGLNKSDETEVINYYKTDKPIQLHVKFLNPDIGKVLRAGYYVYNGKRQTICRLDLYPYNSGIKAKRAVPVYEVIDKKYKTVHSALTRKAANEYIEKNKKDDLSVMEVLKTYEEIDCPGDKCPYMMEGKCKFVATFDFSLAMVGRQMGGWRLSTGSPESFHNLQYAYNAIVGTFGNALPFYTFLLELYPKVKLVDGKFKKTVYLLKLNYQDSLHKLLEERKKQLGISAAEPVLLPDNRRSDTPAVVIAEPVGGDAHEDITGAHGEDDTVIEDADTTPSRKTAAAGQSGGGTGGRAAVSAASGDDKDKANREALLKEIKPFFQGVTDKKLIISQKEIDVIFQKSGIKTGTKISEVETGKLPILIAEVKALVDQKKDADKPKPPAAGTKVIKEKLF